jgi:hypothetical protein
MKSFKKWLNESKDIFAFNKNQSINIDQEKNPIKSINIENINKSLLKIELYEQKPFSRFVNEVQWGSHNGAIRLTISPLGSFKSIIRRLQTDLEGNQVWICKDVIPYKDINDSNPELDESISNDLFDRIQKIYENQLESAINDYDNLKNLAIKCAKECNKPKNLPEIFIFNGITEVKNNHYIISFELKGQGVEGPNSVRIEQFNINLIYERNKGLIRSFGNEIDSPIKGRLWRPAPSEWDEYFSPAQSSNEIIECIVKILKTY